MLWIYRKQRYVSMQKCTKQLCRSYKHWFLEGIFLSAYNLRSSSTFIRSATLVNVSASYYLLVWITLILICLHTVLDNMQYSGVIYFTWFKTINFIFQSSVPSCSQLNDKLPVEKRTDLMYRSHAVSLYMHVVGTVKFHL